MKKILSAVLAALLLAASAGTAVYAADLPEGEAVKGTPTIDGKIDDVWANAPVYNVDRVKDGRDTGLKSTFSAMWDDSALYVLIIAEDADHSFNGGPSVGDGMEIYLDFNNAKTAGFDDDAQAYFAMCANDAETLSYDGSPYGKMILEDAASVAMTTEDGRYIYEAKILDEAMEVELTEGMTIGFDIQVNDQVSGETSRSGAYGWSDATNKAWESPEVFGNLTLTAGGTAAAAPAADASALVIDPLDAPYGMNVEKTTFAYGEDIMITTWGENTNDWVGIYHAEEDSIPGGGSSSRQWFYCYMSDGEEPWNLMDGEGPYAGAPLDPGKYLLYFCFNDGYEIGKTIEITILEDGETAEAPAEEAAPAVASDAAWVTEGLAALYDGANNTNGSQDKAAEIWKDSSGNGVDFDIDIDDANYWTDNAYHANSAWCYFDDAIVDVVNGDKFTVEIVFGDFTGYGASFNTFLNSDNDNFAWFIRNDGDFLEFKNAGNSRPKVAGGMDFVNNSTLTITFDLEECECFMYVDGELIGEQYPVSNVGADSMFLAHADASRNWEADVHCIRYYTTALTAEQIAQNVAADQAKYFTAAAPAEEAAPVVEEVPAEEPAAEEVPAVEEPAVEEVPAEEPAAEEIAEEPAEEIAAEETVEEPAAEVVVEDAPQTFDFGVIAAVSALISLAGYALVKKSK